MWPSLFQTELFNDIRSISRQEEVNIHNLKGVNENIGKIEELMCFAGALGWILFPRSLIVPNRILMLYFLLPSISYTFGLYQDGRDFQVATAVSQEVYELLFALGLFLHAAQTCRKLWVLRGQTIV